ncbi:MAG: TA system VapC family ribonuclease toxin [Burkholderiales bacterium]|nr:TA system VapC family ribonuclease toxin [Burkholderiales bacterium]
MIALDTNLLVYAFRADMPFHREAADVIAELAEAPAKWAIPWPCAHELYAVVTNPRIFKTPTPAAKAAEQLRALDSIHNQVWLAEEDGYLDSLEAILLNARIQGGQVHDARIAAICLNHGVKTLWSADRDFSRFAGIEVRNPLLSR